MVDTTKTKEKPNRAQRRAGKARLRHFHTSSIASRAAAMHEERKQAIAERVKRRVEAARSKSEARAAIRAEIAKKEGVSVRRVVLMGEGNQYVTKKDKSGITQARQEKRHKRHQSFLARITRRAQTV